MKKKLLMAVVTAATLGASASALAATPGFYLGGQIGWANTHYGAGDFTNGNLSVTSANTDANGFSYRPYVGYMFNPNWAAEFGYTGYKNADFTNTFVRGTNQGSGDVAQNAWDLVAKGIIPLADNFNVFAKAGLAYVESDNNGALSNINYQNASNKFRPTVGAGIGYEFNTNVGTDITYTHIFEGNGINNVDAVYASASYYFG